MQQVANGVGTTGGVLLRQDEQGRLLCSARTKVGQPCNAPVVTGLRVCRMHGASSKRAKNAVKMRLADLVDPAIATLAHEMTSADKSADRQAAANSILDRAGVSRVSKVEGTSARDMLLARLLEMAGMPAPLAAAIAQEPDRQIEQIEPG